MRKRTAAQSETPGSFTADGGRYLLRDPRFMERADADLWNDSLHLQIDHRGRCNAAFLQSNRTAYSDNLRIFYVRDDKTGAFWSAPFDPVQTEPEKFEFSPGLCDIQWLNQTDGLELALRLAVAREDAVELWTARLTNRSRRPRRVSLYPCFPIGVLGLLAHQAWFDKKLNGFLHDYFPYYVKHEDYYRLRRLRNQVCCLPDCRPDGFEANLQEFAGWKGLHDPAQLHQPRLSGGDARGDVWNDPSVAAFQFSRALAPGKTFVLNLLLGPVKDHQEALRLRKTYLEGHGVEKALERVRAFQKEHAPAVRIETPDAEFNHYVNHWLPNRALFQARTLRLTLAPQGRNAIQDAMGSVYVDPAAGRKWLSRLWSFQHANGWLPHGMKFAPEADAPPINSIPHKDINVWGPPAILCYLAETGDFGLLDEQVPFADEPERTVSLYEHVCLGLEWLVKDRTARGLSRIGQGDWNDPLNMAGKGERGESVWLSEALAYALDQWAVIVKRRGDPRREEIFRREAVVLRDAVNRFAWDGQWYARGSTDAGKLFGVRADKEGRIFINSQSWALICGAASGDRIPLTIRSVVKNLLTPCGVMTLAPAFQAMREDIGKLSQKVPGTGENGSAYSHAGVFFAFGLYCVRETELAYRVLRSLLPGAPGNPVSRCGQLPLYIPNYYRGLACGRTAGRSSHGANTGTVAWYYRTVVEMLLGARAELDGLRLDPQLPSAWPGAKLTRRWRGAEFEIAIEREKGIKEPRVFLDGNRLMENLVPIQGAGSRHQVRVLVPK